MRDYAAPTAIGTQSYSETIGYNAGFQVTSTTGLNGETLSIAYDGIGRPTTATSPYGAVTTYTYSGYWESPQYQKETGPAGSFKRTLDGLGRVIRVERLSYPGSAVDTVYADHWIDLVTEL